MICFVDESLFGRATKKIVDEKNKISVYTSSVMAVGFFSSRVAISFRLYLLAINTCERKTPTPRSWFHTEAKSDDTKCLCLHTEKENKNKKKKYIFPFFSHPNERKNKRAKKKINEKWIGVKKNDFQLIFSVEKSKHLSETRKNDDSDNCVIVEMFAHMLKMKIVRSYEPISRAHSHLSAKLNF